MLREGKASGNNVTEGGETHDETILFQDHFCAVSVFHGDNAPEIARLRIPGVFQHATRSEPCQCFAAEFFLFVGGDEPVSALSQAQARRFSGTQDLDEIRIHLQFSWVRELHLHQQPKGYRCLECVCLVRLADFLLRPLPGRRTNKKVIFRANPIYRCE